MTKISDSGWPTSLDVPHIKLSTWFIILLIYNVKMKRKQYNRNTIPSCKCLAHLWDQCLNIVLGLLTAWSYPDAFNRLASSVGSMNAGADFKRFHVFTLSFIMSETGESTVSAVISLENVKHAQSCNYRVHLHHREPWRGVGVCSQTACWDEKYRTV